jgi:hypothetical protein
MGFRCCAGGRATKRSRSRHHPGPRSSGRQTAGAGAPSAAGSVGRDRSPSTARDRRHSPARSWSWIGMRSPPRGSNADRWWRASIRAARTWSRSSRPLRSA